MHQRSYDSGKLKARMAKNAFNKAVEIMKAIRYFVAIHDVDINKNLKG